MSEPLESPTTDRPENWSVRSLSVMPYRGWPIAGSAEYRGLGEPGRAPGLGRAPFAEAGRGAVYGELMPESIVPGARGQAVSVGQSVPRETMFPIDLATSAT